MDQHNSDNEYQEYSEHPANTSYQEEPESLKNGENDSFTTEPIHTQHVTESVDEDDEDDFDDFSDFGSFDDTSFNEPEPSLVRFDDELFEDRAKFTAQVDKLMESIFDTPKPIETSSQQLLAGRSLEVFSALSTLPHLKPPNWIKLNIRHNLLIKLGIPINLDEIADKQPIKKSPLLEVNKTTRRKSISTADIHWDEFNIPDIEKLNLSSDSKTQLLQTTPDILSRIETDILNNSSQQFLQDSSSEDALSHKLAQYQSDYEQLLTLSSVWKTHLAEVNNNFDIYESVVQNFIGYSQKLRRDEILDNLKKVKKSNKNKKLW